MPGTNELLGINTDSKLQKINGFISLNNSNKDVRNFLPQNYSWRFHKQYINGAGFLPQCLVVFLHSVWTNYGLYYFITRR